MSVSVRMKVLKWVYNFPFTDWIPIELTGKWKATTIDNISTLSFEVKQREPYGLFGRIKETIMWVDEDDLRIVEEFINECGNSNG